MTFDISTGTHGGRKPRGPMIRLINKVVTSRVRRGTKRMGSFNVLVLHTVGRKSGAERVTPLGWFPGGGGRWLIVASSNGSAGNPAWFHNIAGNPDRVSIEVEGRVVPVRVEQLRGDERTAEFAKIATASPRFGGYQAKTDREIPVLRLTAKE